ncbi:MAG: biotin--[acetyl-CoA-carboxylase] ligase [Nitriliruptorales bacterium]
MDYIAPDARLAQLVAVSGRWREIEHLEVTESTNSVVAARARAGVPAGLVVVADHQTAGRGRFARRWEDRPGGSLLMSCLVEAPARPTLVALAAGLGVADAVARAGAEPELKWPNDVLIAGRKCAGVLIEAPAGTERLVVGIGMNTDWRGEARPGTTAPWTSIAEELDRDVDRWDVLVELLETLDRRLGQGTDRLLADYRQDCSTLGREVEVERRDRPIVGRAVDIDERGALIVVTNDSTVVVDAGDVTHVRPVASGS